MPCGALSDGPPPPFIAARFFSLTWIGVVMPDAPIREVSGTSFQRGQMKRIRENIEAMMRPLGFLGNRNRAPRAQ
jgi:hypothetical protein